MAQPCILCVFVFFLAGSSGQVTPPTCLMCFLISRRLQSQTCVLCFFGKSGLDQVTTPMCFICLSPKMLKISEKAQNHKKCQKSQKMLKICKNVKNHRKRRKGKYLQKVWKIMNFTKNAENHQNAKNNQNAKDHRNY